MSLQQSQLETLREWLTSTEDRISRMSKVGPDLTALRNQLDVHSELQQDLQNQQKVVDALSNLVVVVDETTADNGNIHNKLMSLQQSQLETLREWLTSTEDRISRMSKVGPDLTALRNQLDVHSELQQDLQNQQKVVDALSNLVVVVDETTADNAYSQMEDQLTALGERWAHICQWTEERWSLLKGLIQQGGAILDQVMWLQAWLDSKETVLKNMESEPANEMGTILERIKQLQILRQQMDAQHKRLDHLQDAIHELGQKMNPPGGGEELEKLEALQDRWDALLSIMDVQAQRISNSGFEISLTPCVGDSSESVQTLQAWESNTSSQDGQGSWKRRRVEKQVELQSGLTDMESWLNQTERLLQDKGEPQDAVLLLEEARSEWIERKPHMTALLSLGKTRVQEIITDGGSPLTEEQKLVALEKKFTAIGLQLDMALEKAQREVELKALSKELTSLDLLFSGFSKWFASTPNHSLEQCRVKVKSMKSHEERVIKLGQRSKQLIARPHAGQEEADADANIQEFVTKWTTLMEKLIPKSEPNQYVFKN
ncbi:hypothetical protein LSTR_LSTR015750 [Laodelphax striatellus]|uniref:KASH domain-containing protein n=1 Tax=Laodelphax striatellus TaxID=195883 RepID=A0A482X3V3_LAOST|nr:hypothetical protein LSTR_LSTR015750 [Laodelphax striatellus]